VSPNAKDDREFQADSKLTNPSLFQTASLREEQTHDADILAMGEKGINRQMDVRLVCLPRPIMSTLYQQIGEKFLAELEKSKDVSPKKLAALRPLFAAGKKLKPEDLVKVFTSAEEDEIK